MPSNTDEKAPSIAPRLRVEDAATDLGPWSQWDSKLPKEERPTGTVILGSRIGAVEEGACTTEIFGNY